MHKLQSIGTYPDFRLYYSKKHPEPLLRMYSVENRGKILKTLGILREKSLRTMILRLVTTRTKPFDLEQFDCRTI